MSTDHFGRIGGVRRRRMIATATLAVSLGSLMGASSVLAAPRGIFSVYEQCPASVPGVALCQYAEITSGEFAIGSMRVPIDREIVLQGGAVHTGGENPNEYFEVPATNGASISKTELEIPGGLSTLIDCDAIKGGGFPGELRRGACRAFFGHRRMGASVIVEPAASVSNPVIEDLAALALGEGVGVVFPIRLHLKNPLLGDACYIGSEASPIELHLTDGTTDPPAPAVPIKGNAGKSRSEVEEGFETVTTTDNTLVDNDFSVPVAEGCGGNPHFSSIVDELLDQTLGLESGPGRNTAILTGTHRVARPAGVLASEQFPENNPPPPPPPPHHRHHHQHRWWPAH